MVTMHILTWAVLDYIDNLPVLFVINLFYIVNDNICLHTCCGAFFAKLQESCKNSAIHRWRNPNHSVEKTLSYRIESNKIWFSVNMFELL